MTTYFPYESKNYHTKIPTDRGVGFAFIGTDSHPYRQNPKRQKTIQTFERADIAVAPVELSNTGRPIDAVINNARFMVSPTTGQPVPEHTPQERAAGRERIAIRRAEEEAAMEVQRQRIRGIQSRGDINFYDGSSANDNTPMQKAISA